MVEYFQSQQESELSHSWELDTKRRMKWTCINRDFPALMRTQLQLFKKYLLIWFPVFLPLQVDVYSSKYLKISIYQKMKTEDPH